MSEMHNPPHPGLTLRDDVLPALGLQVGEAASQLGVDRTTLSKVLNGRAAISPAMALRIAEKPELAHGPHRYALEDFGLSAGMVREAFGDYVERFDLTEQRT